jgi:hypothetical protein
MSELTLEQRVQRLEDAEAIKRLKHQYMEYGNVYDADGFITLLTPDTVWDGGEAFGRHEGLEAVAKMVRDAGTQISFSAHFVMNEMIGVDGDRATGKWWLLMPCTVKSDGGGEARWIIAAYDDEYAKVDGRWLVKTTNLDVKVFAPHSKGWAET